MTQKMNNTMVREMTDNELQNVNGGILCWMVITKWALFIAALCKKSKTPAPAK